MEHNEQFLSMLLYPLAVLLTPFLRIFIIKDNPNNERNLSSYLFPVLEFINEETTSCINEEAVGAMNTAATGAIIDLRNSPSWIFI